MAKIRDDSLDAWNLAIEDALEFRRQNGREAEWARNEAMFYQAHETQQSNVGPNILASTGDSMLSALLVPNPFIMVEALEMDQVQSAPVLETQLNKLIKSLAIKSEVDQAGLYAYLYGVGILKLGYDSEFGYNAKQDMGYKQNTILGISLSQFDKQGSRIEYDNLINPGMPWVKSVLPHDFLVPMGTKSLNSAPWCAHRIVRHIDDLRADPKYQNTKDLEPTLSMNDWVQSYLTVMKPYRMGRTQWSTSSKESTSKAEYVELWEIHDTRTRRIRVLAQGYDKWLRDEVDHLQVDGLPFVDMCFVPRSRTFWTTPDTVYLQAAQAEAIDIAAIQRKQRRVSTLRFMYEEDAMDKDELVKFMSGEIGVGIRVKRDRGEKAVLPFTPTNSNNQLQVEGEAVRRDARETVGFGRNQMGTTNPGRPTATEVNIANNKSEMRMDRRVDKVSQCYSDLGCKLSHIIFQFWRTPRVIQIVGPMGAAQWMSYTGPQIKGDYHYSVGFSSDPNKTHETRVQNAFQIYQTFLQDPAVDPIKLRQLLIRAINDPSFTSIFLPGVQSNADVSNLMQQMQAPMGGANSQANLGGGASEEAAVPEVPQQVPQSNVQSSPGGTNME